MSWSAENDALPDAEYDCNGLCVMAREVLSGRTGVAHPHPDCEKHARPRGLCIACQTYGGHAPDCRAAEVEFPHTIRVTLSAKTTPTPCATCTDPAELTDCRCDTGEQCGPCHVARCAECQDAMADEDAASARTDGRAP